MCFFLCVSCSGLLRVCSFGSVLRIHERSLARAVAAQLSRLVPTPLVLIRRPPVPVSSESDVRGVFARVRRAAPRIALL